MKFLFFIASIMLIVLINQHSTMGAPVDDSSVEEQCPEGMKRDKKGVCRKLPSLITVTQQMSVLKKDPEIRYGGCPEGMEHGEHGICHKVQPTETATTREEKLDDCPKGTKRDDEGVCRKLPSLMTITEQMPVFKKDPEIRDGGCPEGMEHGEHGICHEVQSTETTTAREGNLEDCPKGTKRDDQGVCQPIKTTNSKQVTSDPKALRNNGNFCPEGFVKYKRGCLFIKATSTLRSAVLDDKKPKSGNGENDLYETVAMLPDKTCPKGTEYSGPGLCQKRISSSSNSKFNNNSGDKCPAGFRLINDKCMPTNSSEQDQSSEVSSSTSTLPDLSESTTLADEPTPKRKSKTAKVEESTTELPSETTRNSESSNETAAVNKPTPKRKSKIETATDNELTTEFPSRTTRQPL